MESEKCRVLLCAIDKGSITAAAEAMGYTISGVSRMMAALEAEVGFPLLRRSREGVTPTNECCRLLPSFREMVAQAEQCRQIAGEVRGLVSGTVAIGTFSSVATHWLPNMIGAFQKDYPNIDFDILMGTYPEIEQWVMQGRADCGFLHLPTRADLKTVCLAQDELMAVLPEDHPLAALEKIPASALAEQPFILLDKAGERDRDVMQVFERAGIVREGAVHHAGRLRRYVHGGAWTGCQHSAEADPAADPLSGGAASAGAAGFPPDRPCHTTG